VDGPRSDLVDQSRTAQIGALITRDSQHRELVAPDELIAEVREGSEPRRRPTTLIDLSRARSSSSGRAAGPVTPDPLDPEGSIEEVSHGVFVRELRARRGSLKRGRCYQFRYHSGANSNALAISGQEKTPP
jgi:hypothetical protein